MLELIDPKNLGRSQKKPAKYFELTTAKLALFAHNIHKNKQPQFFSGLLDERVQSRLTVYFPGNIIRIFFKP